MTTSPTTALQQSLQQVITEEDHHHTQQQQHEEDDRTTFTLQGFDKEKQLLQVLGKNPSVEQIKRHVKANGDLKTLLSCPLGATYFMKFLNLELNLENLHCYFDAKSLLDFIKYAKKCPLFQLSEVNQFEQKLQRSMSALSFTASTDQDLDDDDRTDTDEIDDASTFPHHNDVATATTTTTTATHTFNHVEYEDDDTSSTSSSSSTMTVEHRYHQPQNRQSFSNDLSSVTSDTGTSTTTTSTSTLKIKRDSSHSEDRSIKFGDQVSEKTQKFFSTYIVENASNEVNIDANLRKLLVTQFQKISSLRGELKKELHGPNALQIASEMKVNVEKMEGLLDDLQTQLLVNLNDPFARFKDHPLLDEALTLFATANDTNYHRNRLLSADKGGVVLNNLVAWTNGMLVRSPLTVASSMLGSIIAIISDESLWTWDEDKDILVFNYESLTTSPHKPWRMFQDNTSELAQVDLSLLVTDHEKLAFWINVFNVLMIHAAIIAQGIPVLELTRELFYRKTKYTVGGHEFSLEDIRDGILFGNHVRNIILGRQFKKHDPRKKFSVKQPILHTIFALSDLTIQSPLVEIMNYEQIYDQLNNLATVYLDSFITVDPDNKVVAPALLMDRRSLLKEFTKSNDVRSVNIVDSAVFFVKQYATRFQKEEHKDDIVIFRDTNQSVTNLSCALNRRDLEILVKMKKPAEPKKKASTELRRTSSEHEVHSEEALKQKCSWNRSGKCLSQSLRNMRIKFSNKVSVAMQTSHHNHSSGSLTRSASEPTNHSAPVVATTKRNSRGGNQEKCNIM